MVSDDRKIKFSISHSSKSLYESSQLLFYYSYLLKLPPDTKVVEVYGDAGNCVHKILEKYIKKEVINFDVDFYNLWITKALDKQPGFNGKPLKHNDFLKAAQRGKDLLDKKYPNAIAEETIEFPLYNDPMWKIKIKGVIDCQATLNDEKVIVDWKTNSEEKEEHREQGLMYAYLVYRKYGYIPTAVIFEYTKIDKTVRYTYTPVQIAEFENSLYVFRRSIVDKGLDISNY